jgi:hypothetical protein
MSLRNMNENKGWVSEKESSMRSRMGVSISLMYNYDMDLSKQQFSKTHKIS